MRDIKTLKVKITNNFHNSSCEKRAWISTRTRKAFTLCLSSAQMKEVDKALCGISGCICGPMKVSTKEGSNLLFSRDEEGNMLIYDVPIPKERIVIHREHFRPVSRGRRRTCTYCGQRLDKSEYIYSWGEYVYGKFRAIQDCCKKCFPISVKPRLESHKEECGCDFILEVSTGLGQTKPSWLTM